MALRTKALDVLDEMIERGERRTGYVRWFWTRVGDVEAFIGGGTEALCWRRSLRRSGDLWARYEAGEV